jgi:chemotaxis protein histidine kinase CheA
MSHIATLKKLLDVTLRRRNALDAYIRSLQDAIEKGQRLETIEDEMTGMQVAVPAASASQPAQTESQPKFTQRMESNSERKKRLEKALRNPSVSMAEFSADDINFIERGPLRRLWNVKKRAEAKAIEAEQPEEPKATEDKQPEEFKNAEAEQPEESKSAEAEQPEESKNAEAEQPEEPKATEAEQPEEPKATEDEQPEEPKATEDEQPEKPKATEDEQPEAKSRPHPGCMPQQHRDLHVVHTSENSVSNPVFSSTQARGPLSGDRLSELMEMLEFMILRGVICDLPDEDDRDVMKVHTLRIMKKIMQWRDKEFSDVDRNVIDNNLYLQELIDKRPALKPESSKGQKRKLKENHFGLLEKFRKAMKSYQEAQKADKFFIHGRELNTLQQVGLITELEYARAKEILTQQKAAA